MRFIKTLQSPSPQWDEAFILIFSKNGHILVDSVHKEQEGLTLFSRMVAHTMPLDDMTFLGSYNSIPCFCASWSAQDPPSGYKWLNLRKLMLQVPGETWNLAGYAKQIHDCNVNFKYCGKCGRLTRLKEDEQGRFCETCNLNFYPRISPAVIMAVIKEDKILLARGINFPNKKMFSVLAGFVDPQERLEDCVKREVFEETGIKVKNVQYFDSQPWPFPDSLMIGFTAQYESGTISIDPDEIAEAAWFSADELPLVPGKPTLSGELIQWFVRQQLAFSH